MARTRWPPQNPLLLSLVVAVAFLAANVDATIFNRDGMHEMHQHHHRPPLLEFNETELLLYHAPTPDSYYTIDWEGAGGLQPTRHSGLMVIHAILMSLAFFVALPLGIALRSARHPARSFAVMAFYGLCIVACASSALYRKLTPNMYEGAIHARHGYFIMILALSLSTLDILSLFHRVYSFFRTDEKFTFKSFWRSAILGQDQEQRYLLRPEYTGLMASQDHDGLEHVKLHSSVRESSDDLGPARQYNTASWVNNVPERHYRRQSIASEGTLYGNSPPNHSLENIQYIEETSKVGFLCRLRSIGYAVVERFLVFAGFAQLLTGIVTYTGGCRENYVNGCLAHLIKGGIFWCYGLFTFARFLGTFSERGWAWNRSPTKTAVTAEFVECLVIFAYGATNTWMERFGAHTGDPFTTKQIQHISIAVMFWFAGLIGMGLESKTIRGWISSATFSAVPSNRLQPDLAAEPPSYIASFNPFPALVIGVTGAAMAAHAQTYLFQVQIHELWGNLLITFSVLRCLTYFFMWLGPPRSILPSRPPTEALGSFFLACGGLVFMFSTEEVTIAAMRRGRDDVMMFLNLAVAITCFAFCWTLSVVGFNGWLKSRSRPAPSYHHAA